MLFGCWCHGDVPWMVEQEALIPVAQDNRLALPQLKTVELGVCVSTVDIYACSRRALTHHERESPSSFPASTSRGLGTSHVIYMPAKCQP